MRSPLALKGTLYKYRNVIQSLIPSSVNTLILPSVRDMELELYFLKKYKILCSTYDYRIYDFWNSYFTNPQRIFSMAGKLFKSIEFDNYTEISELYYSQSDSNMRSAIFLLMNACGNQEDFFKDSFNLRKAVLVEDFLSNHTHFVPSRLKVNYYSLEEQLGDPLAFTILDLPEVSYINKIPVVSDTSFTEKQIIDLLKANINWSLKTNLNHTTRKYLDIFDFYFLNETGYRSLSETNKILFYKT